MNERIRELIKSLGIIPEDEHYEVAELIVKECMDLVKDCYAEPESGQSPYQTVCASTLIEEHFGVRE